LTHFCADRFEWAVSMLLQTEAVDVGAVRSIDRLLEAGRKIPVEVCHLWPLLVDDIGCHVISLFIREHRGVEHSADGHVVHRIGRGGQKAAHPSASVVAVGTPKRWKQISGAGLGALPRSI